MKKIIISIIAIILGTTFFVSCQDSNTSDPPTIVGKWLLVEASIQTDDDASNQLLNNMFKQIILELDTERDFQVIENPKDTINTAAVWTTRTIKDGSKEPLKTYGEYRIVKDVLVVGGGRSTFLLSNAILTTTCNLSNTELIAMVADFGKIDPNTLPQGLSGVYRTKEIRRAATQ